MPKLSRMQQKVYDFIVEFLEKNGYPPAVREIGDALGLKSPSTVHFHIKHLEELGMLEKGAGKGRALTLTNRHAALAAQAVAPVEAPELPDRVPLVGNVAAGSPILAQECIEDYIAFDTGGREGEYFALRVRGESMLGAGILPDDIVIVHRRHTAYNGEIVVALIDEEATVKTYCRKDGHLWLLPENDEYEPIDGDGAQILGKVTAVIRHY